MSFPVQTLHLGELEAKIDSVLANIQRSLPGLFAVGLGDANGLPIAFLGPKSARAAALAMATLLIRAAEQATKRLGLPGLRDLLIENDDFTVMVRPVADRFALLVILRGEANLGLARLKIQSHTDDLRIALEGEWLDAKIGARPRGPA